MSERVARILEMVRGLSPLERDELVDELIGSAPATWTPELERRAREALRGENLVGEASEVIARARADLRASR